MKAENLNIKDWVLHDGNPVQVREIITGVEECGEINCDWVYSELYNSIRCDALQPIPLTEAILSLNGFEPDAPTSSRKIFELHLPSNPGCDYANHMEIWQLISGKYCVRIEYNIKNGECNMCQKVFEFVHELQHALRLCELTNLANNLKIK